MRLTHPPDPFLTCGRMHGTRDPMGPGHLCRSNACLAQDGRRQAHERVHLWEQGCCIGAEAILQKKERQGAIEMNESPVRLTCTRRTPAKTVHSVVCPFPPVSVCIHRACARGQNAIWPPTPKLTDCVIPYTKIYLCSVPWPEQSAMISQRLVTRFCVCSVGEYMRRDTPSMQEKHRDCMGVRHGA